LLLPLLSEIELFRNVLSAFFRRFLLDIHQFIYYDYNGSIKIELIIFDTIIDTFFERKQEADSVACNLKFNSR